MRLPKYLYLLLLLLASTQLLAQRGIWTKEQANAWYARQPWLVGANYAPYNAINQLEMWQAETFDPATIEKELVWAENLGMNTMRVFLHDKLWQQDPAGFKKRIDQFLTIAARHHIRPMLVLFDSCWDPFPHAGRQHEPVQGLHNSGWVQSPGADILKDTGQYPMLESYVKDIVGHFKNDDRVVVWDVWNEPDNTNASSYGRWEPVNKVALVINLLPQVFAWAREVNPSQPLTAGVWAGNWSDPAKLKPIDKIQLEESDIISFHNYDNGEEFEKRIQWLQPYGRPILCTEYMSRGNKSTFEGSLPVAKKYKVAAYNWGFVAGKTNTIYPWDSWQKPYATEPDLWFHDIFRPDGQPYKQAEVDLIKNLTTIKKEPVKMQRKNKRKVRTAQAN